MERADSPPLSVLAEEDSQPQVLSDEPQEDKKLTDLTEQNEDNKSQDPNEQSEGGIEIHPETSEQQSSEETEEDSPVSGSWGKYSTDWADETSSFAPSELSTSSRPYFQSTSSRRNFPTSESSRPEATEDLASREESQEIPDLSEYEELPLSSWEKRATEWKFERAGHPVPKQKTSFHMHCCSSTMEETIKQSPLKFAKSSQVRGFVQEQPVRNCKGMFQPVRNFKGGQIISPYERMWKQRVPVGLQRKKESREILDAQLHSSGSCTGCCSHLGRRSKALYNLYTTFCDEDNEKEEEEEEENEDIEPGFFQRVEGSPATSGVSRACTIFGFVKKGRINVSNLLLTLHTMGILMSRTEMHQALKCIAVDERGNLNFLEFLNVISLTTPFSGTKALQKARQVFRKLKKDVVAFDDLESTLACLGVNLSPTIIIHALGCIPITWDRKLNISDFLTTARGLQSCCDKAAYPDEYPALNFRSFGDADELGDSELKWKRKGSPDRQPIASPMIAFCSAEEAIAFTDLQKQKSKPQRPVDLKRPSTASPVCPAEENKKKKGIIKWPRVRPSFGYNSQDTLFPLESTLCHKKPENAPAQQEETEDKSCEDSASLPDGTPKVSHPKKKRLSFSQYLPKRYSSEDRRIPILTVSEPNGEGNAEDPSE